MRKTKVDLSALASSQQASDVSMEDVLRDTFPSFTEIETTRQRAGDLKHEALQTVAALLRGARQERGYSQKELAGRMGVSQPAVSRLEACEDDTNGPTIASLTEYLNQCGHRLELRAVPMEQPEDAVPDMAPSLAVPEYVDTLSSLNLFFVETDPSDRIIRSNIAWQGLHDRIKRWSMNVKFYDFLQAGLDNGLFPGAYGDPDWLEKRMTSHQSCGAPFEVARQDGIVLRVKETRTPSGGVMTVSKDVTLDKTLRQLFALTQGRGVGVQP